MYMYYLLGYKCFGSLQKMEELYERDPFDKDIKTKEFIGFGNLLKNIDSNLREKVTRIFCLFFFSHFFRSRICFFI